MSLAELKKAVDTYVQSCNDRGIDANTIPVKIATDITLCGIPNTNDANTVYFINNTFIIS